MLALDEYITFLDRKITTRLSLAVALIDGYTGKQPIGYVKIFIKDQNLKAFKNRSGYYLFFNLPDGEYTVRSDSEYYFDEETPVKSSDLDPLNPVVSIRLEPKPSYPFPSGATLIRGMVQNSNRNPASEAKVEIAGKEVSNRTTVKGEFVLYFNALTEDDIIVEDTKRFVKGNGDKTIHLKATHDTKTGTADLEEVQERKTTPLGSPIILS